MTALFWIVIVGGIGLFILFKLLEVCGEIFVSTGTNLFGRADRTANILTIPPEFNKTILTTPSDSVVNNLNTYCRSHLPFHLGLLEWTPLWISETDGQNTALVTDIEALLSPLAIATPPYELIDQPSGYPPFPNGDIEPPPEPPLVPEEYPEPVLSLPYWGAPLDFLNTFVDKAHQKVIDQYNKLQETHTRLEETANILNQARKHAWGNACKHYKELVALREKQYESYLTAKAAYEAARSADFERLRQAKNCIENNNPEGVMQHFDLVLRRLNLPVFVPREWKLNFEDETKTLLLEHRFPETARLDLTKVVQQARGKVAKPVNQTGKKKLIPMVQPALCVQLAIALAKADCFDLVDAIAVNGWVDFFDRGNGQPKRAYCASLIAKKADLLSIKLDTADPVAAFKSLCGANAGETYETAPVMPSLRLQTEDPRFVEPRETLEKMAKGENLAAMDWETFEHLVRELFEKVFSSNGSEVKITRSSRDQGVDAVIFDPDPIKGGKIVIQAKRYTIPVGVSAVRDLYGTVMNEGANTGILVTTSHYGPDAYEFAQNKNIKLINGAQLLGLLEQTGYQFRIDLAEAREFAGK